MHIEAIHTCALVTVRCTQVLEVRLANNVIARFLGLMLRRPLGQTQALLITRCSSVHSAFMRYPIDVVYLSADGIVCKCVRGMKPWRGSFSNFGTDAQGKRHPRAVHTLELSEGSIEAFGIAPGDRLMHPHWRKPLAPVVPTNIARPRQRGSSMIEFTVVGPVITLSGLAILQYGMLFFAKSQINHASFMAAREGAMANASISAVQGAYLRALVPLYGGGQTPEELATSLANATADLGPNGAGNVNIELLNPTKESFADWDDPSLHERLKTGGKRVIPFSGQARKDQAIGATSGQTIQDANLIKLRITHGYLPKVPFVNDVYTTYLKWLDPKSDAFHTKLVNDGRIPIVTSVTLHMQSDAIEPGAPVSTPGLGNHGNPSDPGTAPVANDPPPDCNNLNCDPSTPAPAPPETTPPATTPPATTPPSTPACNPLFDANHCDPTVCVPGAEMCCMPK